MSSRCECCFTVRRCPGLPLALGARARRANRSSLRMQRAGHPSHCLERDGGFCSAPICGAQRSPDSNGGVISLLRRLVCARSGEARGVAASLLYNVNQYRCGELQSAAPATPIEQPCVLGPAPSSGTRGVLIDEGRPHITSQRHPTASGVSSTLKPQGLSTDGKTHGQVIFECSRAPGVHVCAFHARP